MGPFPVMHGSMFVEVDNIQMCEITECNSCAYQLHKRDETLPMFKVNCHHRLVLKGIFEVTV